MFRDSTKKREYDEKGFTVLTMPDTVPIQALYEILHKNCDNYSSTGFYYSLMGDAESNLKLKMLIAEVMRPVYDHWFWGYASASESFLIKGEKDLKELELHQDWCYVDEDCYSPITLWIPLQATNAENGCMFFLPGSHLSFKGLRSGSYPTARVSAMGRLESFVEALPLNVGQAIAFHPAVFHGSYPNRSGKARKVMAAMILPDGVPMRYYQRLDDRCAEVYAINEHTFFRELLPLSIGNPPSGAPLLNIRPYIHFAPDEESLFMYR